MPLTAAIPLLVPTKLAPPRLHTGLIPRERLLALLGDKPATRLTLLIAPAGFGKSTLAAQWLFGAESANVALPPPRLLGVGFLPDRGLMHYSPHPPGPLLPQEEQGGHRSDSAVRCARKPRSPPRERGLGCGEWAAGPKKPTPKSTPDARCTAFPFAQFGAPTLRLADPRRIRPGEHPFLSLPCRRD